ncbi:MAG: hypothetical protein JXQ67_05030 [Campylobacterales bacterium]|nr:hypothetical protein [Campylobacterales bacterium]
MQIFGKFLTNFDMDYLNEHYIYISGDEDEKITVEDLENMLKKKRKNVCGTIFLYNPEHSPIGYKMSRFLRNDGFEGYGKFVPLNEDPTSYVINAGLKEHYRGKLVEIKYLFSYNRENIAPTPIIEEFDADLDKLTSGQLTRYDRNLNYIDVPNVRLSGKFVFFGMGSNYDRHHKAIIAYARALSAQVHKLDKDVVFIYDRNCDLEEAIEQAYFIHPYATGKMKEVRANAFKEVFKTLPPQVVRLN